jgi:hypothetical protein
VDWWRWWGSLQPEDRVCEPHGQLQTPSINMDWEELQKPGRDGFLLVMMTLTWWGKLSSTDSEWMWAVRDASAVLHCLSTTTSPPSPSLSLSLPHKCKAVSCIPSMDQATNSLQGPAK